MAEPTADLLVRNAKLVATCDDAGPGARRRLGRDHRRPDLRGGRVGRPGARRGARRIDASGCLVTPGLVNTHHHIYQNLTRSFGPAINGSLFSWLTALYPLWAGIDEEAAYLSAWVGLAELALGGCTTTTDHLYVAPRGGGDLWSAEIAAARELGLRFHPTRGSMTLSGRTAGCRRTRSCRTTTRCSPTASGWWACITTRRSAPWCGWRSRPCSPFSRLARADAADRRAGGAARRPAAHPPGRGPGRGHVLPGAVRPAAGRAVRGGRLAHLAFLGGALHLPEPGRGGAAGRGRGRRRALPELQHADRRRRVRAGAASSARPGCRSAWAATGPRRPTARRCGSSPGRRCCSAGSGWGRPG